ncbi:hypothetical protein ABEB36_007348 [Hypothenemus hampei]|uniref:Uncharacterized protein n=1 Tax=Hypothenemus hampei TaxID=57062 RepID=A0ABD1ETN0_HYPHA
MFNVNNSNKENLVGQPIDLQLLLKLPAYRLHMKWDTLPENLKTSPELQSHLPCFEHYNRPDREVHIDGPPPSKSKCRACKRSNQ